MKSMTRFKYKIIASSSAGNSVVVNDMLFDIGLPYGKIKPYLDGIKYIFITHRHTDHYKYTTAKYIKRNYPDIKWIGNWDIARLINLDHIVGDSTKIKLDDRTIESFACIHDVPTTGYVVTWNRKKLIYATDTASLKNAPKCKYDYFFIESNHDEKKINTMISKGKSIYGYDVFGNAKRHLSTQQSRTFYLLNRRSRASLWVELHKSSRFY